MSTWHGAMWKISRPRFWIYVFGPYLVGAISGAARPDDLLNPIVAAFGLFFLLPANLLIYGVNDIFDYETDRLNLKKEEYEALLAPAEHNRLIRLMLALCLPFALLLPATNGRCVAAMGAFLFFSLFYSAPPIRAKTIPIVDSIFNVLYILPGIFSYFLLGGQHLSPFVVAASWAWSMAMHAYSAVPDISADRRSGLNTVATLLGFRGTLFFCLGLYVLAALLAFSALGALSLALGLVYAALMLHSLRMRGESELLAVYKIFPLVNTLSGACLFFAVLLQRMGRAA